MNLLNSLDSDEIALQIALLTSPDAIRRTLLQRDEVKKVRRALAEGILSGSDIRAWIAELMSEFRKGFRFIHESALCALVVAVESWPSPFVDELISELSQLKISEMPLSPRVAARAIEVRKQMFSPTTLRTFQITPPTLPKTISKSLIFSNRAPIRCSIPTQKYVKKVA